MSMNRKISELRMLSGQALQQDARQQRRRPEGAGTKRVSTAPSPSTKPSRS
jgi:hypothetical protein